MINPYLLLKLREHEGYSNLGTEICMDCGCGNATRNRQLTEYTDEEDNFCTLCPDCQKRADEYWNDMWDMYYSSQGL